MRAVRKLLLEILNDLSSKEFKKFQCLLQFKYSQKGFPYFPIGLSERADLLVDFMVQIWDQQFVEVTKEIFMDMNRTDLVQVLSETSSGPRAAGSSAEAFEGNTTVGEKQYVDEHWPALTQKVETMASVIELLLETLKDLSDEELERFKDVLLSQTDYYRHFLDIPSMLLDIRDMQHTVFLMVLTYGQQSVERTKEFLKEMKRTDLVQRLSYSSSGPKKKHSDEHRPALIQKVATVAAVKQLLLETLNDLSNEELQEFKEFLQLTVSQKSLPDISLLWIHPVDRAVDVMVLTYGQQAVELTREVLKKMNKTDLMQRLSKPSSGLIEKQSVVEHRPALSERDYRETGPIFITLGKLVWHGPKTEEMALSDEVVTTPLTLREVTITAVKQILLETLKDLSNEELQKFKWLLQFTYFKKSLPHIPWGVLNLADRDVLVVLMVKTWGQQSVEVTREVFMDMNRTDLVERLSETSSGLKGPSRSLELEGGGSIVQDSSDWTKIEPEVNRTDADESPTYSLQSEAGNFECGVSGLRWVCKQKVSFKYQFCSWEEPMERMESIRYMAAGPLININIIAGKLDEVYLPHWICIHDNPTLLDKFAVLHIEDCGDVVEKVSEVTSSHIKLSEPVFSPRAALMKVGLPVKINCNVLIYYKPNTPFLILHVYLIPLDPALQQTMDRKKKGFKIIQKPRPDKYLKMQQGFRLTADIDTATIHPEKITLRYDCQDPNFYEVFIENPDRNFHLTLSCLYKRKGKQQCEPVWNCEIRKVDYQNSGDSEESTGPCDGATVREEHSVEEKEATITTDRVRLLKMLENLSMKEFEGFKWYLRDRDFLAGLPCIPHHLLEKSDMLGLVDLMLHTYSQQSVEVTKKVLKEICRNDLVQVLSDTSSGSKAAGSSA